MCRFEDKVELDKKAGEIKKVVESLVDNRGVAFIGKQPEAVISQLITMPNVKVRERYIVFNLQI